MVQTTLGVSGLITLLSVGAEVGAQPGAPAPLHDLHCVSSLFLLCLLQVVTKLVTGRNHLPWDGFYLCMGANIDQLDSGPWALVSVVGLLFAITSVMMVFRLLKRRWGGISKLNKSHFIVQLTLLVWYWH